jgi:hypothetical protein
MAAIELYRVRLLQSVDLPQNEHGKFSTVQDVFWRWPPQGNTGFELEYESGMVTIRCLKTRNEVQTPLANVRCWVRMTEAIRKANTQ